MLINQGCVDYAIKQLNLRHAIKYFPCMGRFQGHHQLAGRMTSMYLGAFDRDDASSYLCQCLGKHMHNQTGDMQVGVSFNGLRFFMHVGGHR